MAAGMRSGRMWAPVRTAATLLPAIRSRCSTRPAAVMAAEGSTITCSISIRQRTAGSSSSSRTNHTWSTRGLSSSTIGRIGSRTARPSAAVSTKV